MDSRSIDFVINQKEKKKEIFFIWCRAFFVWVVLLINFFNVVFSMNFSVLFTCDRVVRPKWDSNPVLEGSLLLLQRMLYLYWMWRPKLVGIHYRSIWHFLLYYFWIRPRMWCSCLVNCSLRFCKQKGSKCRRRDTWSCLNPETPYPVLNW